MNAAMHEVKNTKLDDFFLTFLLEAGAKLGLIPQQVYESWCVRHNV